MNRNKGRRDCKVGLCYVPNRQVCRLDICICCISVSCLQLTANHGTFNKLTTEVVTSHLVVSMPPITYFYVLFYVRRP